ncbi:unnamed protein product [Bemisia tabaci]|uniref:Uncharacterized protein n=1 Tax=Bemisia tabaci TaxID=7038 RepID=A0A9P0A3E5_BEMTA|nr:unnamed protein product [Bemisia tabaci]
MIFRRSTVIVKLLSRFKNEREKVVEQLLERLHTSSNFSELFHLYRGEPQALLIVQAIQSTRSSSSTSLPQKTTFTPAQMPLLPPVTLKRFVPEQTKCQSRTPPLNFQKMKPTTNRWPYRSFIQDFEPSEFKRNMVAKVFWSPDGKIPTDIIREQGRIPDLTEELDTDAFDEPLAEYYKAIVLQVAVADVTTRLEQRSRDEPHGSWKKPRSTQSSV